METHQNEGSFAAKSGPPENRASSQPPSFVVLCGNPNSGKTTLFNALTGLRARVGNYAGVTVERKEGRLQGAPSDLPVTVLDLPGTYSLSPQSLDEQIARDILFCRLAEVPAPAMVVVVVDASNLERNLYFATQVIELGYPTLIALNMIDVAKENGNAIDASQLGAALGTPVVPLVASTGNGVADLREKIVEVLRAGPGRVVPQVFCELPIGFRTEIANMAQLLGKVFTPRGASTNAEALLILCDERFSSRDSHYPAEIRDAVAAARLRLEGQGID